jgi:hypothetical protein
MIARGKGLHLDRVSVDTNGILSARNWEARGVKVLCIRYHDDVTVGGNRLSIVETGDLLEE